MFNPEETIRLELDFGQSSQQAGEVSQSLKTVETSTTAATNAFAQIKAETAALEKELKTLNLQFRDGKLDLDTYTVRAEGLRGAIAEGKKITGEATGEVRGFGRGLLDVSFAVQDFTSQLGTRGLAGGLAAIQNNIPGILTGLGAGAGLAGVVSIAALGVGGLATALSGVSREAKDAAKEIEDVVKAAGRLREARPKSEEQKGKEIADWMREFPELAGAISVSVGMEDEQQIRAALEARARDEMIPGSEAYAVRVLQRNGRRTDVNRELATEMRRTADERRRRADELLLGVSKGDVGALGAVAAMARAQPGMFPFVASDLESFLPGGDTGDADLDAAEAFGERARRGMASRRAAGARQTARQRAEVSTRQFGAAMDFDEMEADAREQAARRGLNRQAEQADRDMEQDRKRRDADRLDRFEAGAKAARVGAASRAVRQVEEMAGEGLPMRERHEAVVATQKAMDQGVTALAAALGAVRDVVANANRIRGRFAGLEQEAQAIRQINNMNMNRGRQ